MTASNIRAGAHEGNAAAFLQGADDDRYRIGVGKTHRPGTPVARVAQAWNPEVVVSRLSDGSFGPGAERSNPTPASNADVDHEVHLAAEQLSKVRLSGQAGIAEPIEDASCHGGLESKMQTIAADCLEMASALHLMKPTEHTPG